MAILFVKQIVAKDAPEPLVGESSILTAMDPNDPPVVSFLVVFLNWLLLSLWLALIRYFAWLGELFCPFYSASGVYYVLGDHDYYLDKDETKRMLEE